MGTPEFAVPSLKALTDDDRYDIVGVITQPDRPAGRGKKLTACPVKQFALEHGLPVYQFERLRKPEGVEQLKALAPDVVITAAFGQILTQALLDIPRFGTLNVHASLLPRHRGSAPINWCILMGERETGVTIMRTDVGMDTGDILRSAATPIGELETAGELTDRLCALGAGLLAETLPDYLEGRIDPIPQDNDTATYEPMLDKAMGDMTGVGNRMQGAGVEPVALRVHRHERRAAEALPGAGCGLQRRRPPRHCAGVFPEGWAVRALR